MKKFSSITRANSRQTSRNKRLKIIVWIGFVVVVLLLVLPRAMSVTASLVMTPVVAIEDWLFTSQDTVPAYFRDRNALLEEQQDLKRQLAELQGSNHAINQLVIENDSLRTLLGNGSTSRIAAGVVGRPTELPYDTLVIDRGSNQGIMKHAPVFVGRNQAIGFVGEVFSDSAVIVLVTTPDVESTVYLYGPNIYTTATGVGGGVMRVHVPQGIDLAVGNLAIMPAFDAGIYGAVVSIESVATRPEQFGYVSIDVPLSGLRFVSVGEAPLQSVDFEDAKAIVERERNNVLKVPVPEGVLVDTGVNGSSTATTTATSTDIL